MEELVNKLAELQAEQKYAEGEAESASIDVDEMIRSVEIDLMDLKKKREGLRKPHVEVVKELQTAIEDIQQTIIDAWSGEKKTLRFDAGTLKFRTSQSLRIIDRKWLLADLLDHTTIEDVSEKYIKGFNMTAVKKYMGVHDIPIDVAEIEYKTAVKLEV